MGSDTQALPEGVRHPGMTELKVRFSVAAVF